MSSKSLENTVRPAADRFLILLKTGGPQTAADLGKATGADRERAKPTHPAVIGIAASQERVRLLHAQALEALAPFGQRAAPLRSLAAWLLTRRF